MEANQQSSKHETPIVYFVFSCLVVLTSFNCLIFVLLWYLSTSLPSTSFDSESFTQYLHKEHKGNTP